MNQPWMERERLLLAPYAMQSSLSRGRKHREGEHPYRSPYQRDRDRIIHTASFRRLSSKTQVFTGEVSDYHRTRLTHTLEVSSIARTIGRALRLNEDLIEALALMHDIGHPPFGHAGEEALDDCLREHGGFSHNQHALTIVEVLERRYPDFPGLNLTEEVLAGQGLRADKPSMSQQPVLLEVQAVDTADSIAYDTHDADDALELGLLHLEELLELPLWREATRRVRRRWTNLQGRELERSVLKDLIDWQVGDVLWRAQDALRDAVGPPGRGGPLGHIVAPSPELAELKAQFEAFLHARVYRHPQIVRIRDICKAGLKEHFEQLTARPERLPPEFQARARQAGVHRAAGEYLGCLTDRAAQAQWNAPPLETSFAPSGGFR